MRPPVAPRTAALLIAALVLPTAGSYGVRLALDDEQGHRSSSLLSAEPTPGTTPRSTDPTPTLSPTSPVASSQEASPAPRTAHPGTGSATSPITVERSSLLSTRYQEAAFGQGRAAQVDDVPAGVAVPGTCFDLDTGGSLPGDPPSRRLARTWSWPAEVVVTEVLAEFGSRAEAKAFYDSCEPDPDPNYVGTWERNGTDVRQRVDVGETGFLQRIPREVSTTMYGGTRVGRFVLLLNWRQGGGDTSLAPLEAALADALAAARGEHVGPPVAAPSQVVPPELRGYLTRAQLPDSALGGGPLTWLNDYAEPAHLIPCQGQTGLATTGVPWARNWTRPTSRTQQELLSTAVGVPVDPASVSEEFSACRASFERSTALAGVGDEGFAVEQPGGGSAGYARSGSTYFRVEASYALAPEALTELLRAAIAARAHS